VDVWHCDAEGIYSGVTDAGFDTTGQKWLRGFQVTDENGAARFTTIYPGWYSGRTVHIHFEIRTDGSDGRAYEFTSQLFFDEAITAQVYAQAPYSAKGQPDTTNASDGIYQAETLLTPTRTNDGYSATLDIALDLSDAEVGADDSAQGGGPGGRP
jgi:protocatechuate 3,4-dioxygenase beta subunit